MIKLFDYSMAGAGLTIENALSEGFDAISVQMAQFDRSHFYPEKDLMHLELVVEKETKRILGIQGFGAANDAMVGRINAVAALLPYEPVIEDLSNLEIAYSPPFASAMDVINTLGNVAENVLEGRCRLIDQKDFNDFWKNHDKNDFFVIDARAEEGGKPFEKKYPQIWKSIPHDQLKRRIDEVPKDENKKILLICNTGMRSYETQLDLDHHGIKNTLGVAGGMSTLKKWGLFDE